MLWKVFDFVTLGTFDNNMKVPSEERSAIKVEESSPRM
jgi:hypothetical protein